MRSKLSIIVVTFLFVGMVSCKKEKKNSVDYGTKNSAIEKKPKAAFSLSDAENKIDWIAYKFSEKTPVKGKFEKVSVTAGGDGNSIREAIHSSEFSIPISSIFTSDTSRDYKIKKFFFGIMENTKLLSGKLIIENDSLGLAEVTMNGITRKLPFSYLIEGKKFSMTAKMDVLNWNAQSSIDSLNTICKDLHKGLDGISKLWSEVDINVISTFK